MDTDQEAARDRCTTFAERLPVAKFTPTIQAAIENYVSRGGSGAVNNLYAELGTLGRANELKAANVESVDWLLLERCLHDA